MPNPEFHDNTERVIQAIYEQMGACLEECAGELESRVKRNSRVDTGETKNSFRHVVDTQKLEVQIGSSEQNAIWEEFGTGEHALNGDGRPGGWSYRDGWGFWHYTTGKKPSRAFWRAYTELKARILERIKHAWRGIH